MQKIIVSISLLAMVLVFASLNIADRDLALISGNSVNNVLKELGDRSIIHYPKTNIVGASAQAGEELVLHGITKNIKGAKTKKQSKHFVCTSCHNIEREDPDLSISDPQARLEYTNKKGLPFLQGTSLYGAVNRTNFYNGDYDKKYGDLVKPARNNIREAIQLCAVECAQGRRLKNWEVESVLAYLWTLELRMKDLNLTEKELKQIKTAKRKKGKKQAAIELIKSKYLDGSPATFAKPPEDRKKGLVEKGDPQNGKLIYDNSCKYCHEKARYSYFELDDNPLTFKYLEKHLSKYTRYSLYQVARYGTPPLNGKRAYMPQYTLEKMSNQQLEDLRAYIEQEAR